MINPLLINMYLVSCEYFSDAERKRIEYAFNKYESEAKEMDKIAGASRIVRDEDEKNFFLNCI